MTHSTVNMFGFMQLVTMFSQISETFI